MIQLWEFHIRRYDVKDYIDSIFPQNVFPSKRNVLHPVVLVLSLVLPVGGARSGASSGKLVRSDFDGHRLSRLASQVRRGAAAITLIARIPVRGKQGAAGVGVGRC